MSKKVVTKKKALADDKSQRARVQHDFARELLKIKHREKHPPACQQFSAND